VERLLTALSVSNLRQSVLNLQQIFPYEARSTSYHARTWRRIFLCCHMFSVRRQFISHGSGWNWMASASL